MIVSTSGHKPIDIENVLEFYNYNSKENLFRAYNQDEAFIVNDKSSLEGPFALEGNGAKNYKKFLEKNRFSFNVINNSYCLIDDLHKQENGYVYIDKSITISANGNAFAGCSQSFEKVDSGTNICNILQCHNNLYEKIDLYSWEYPLSIGQNRQLKNLLISRWNHEHGISIKNCMPNKEAIISEDDEKTYELFGSFIDGFKDLEELIRQIHKEYPLFNHWEAQMLGLYSRALSYFDNSLPEDYQKTFYLQLYSGVTDPCSFENVTRDEIVKTFNDLLNIYKQRILESDPLCNFLYKLGAI